MAVASTHLCTDPGCGRSARARVPMEHAPSLHRGRCWSFSPDTHVHRLRRKDLWSGLRTTLQFSLCALSARPGIYKGLWDLDPLFQASFNTRSTGAREGFPRCRNHRDAKAHRTLRSRSQGCEPVLYKLVACLGSSELWLLIHWRWLCPYPATPWSGWHWCKWGCWTWSCSLWPWTWVLQRERERETLMALKIMALPIWGSRQYSWAGLLLTPQPFWIPLFGMNLMI